VIAGRLTPKAPRLSARQREAISFYLLISPWLIGFIAFTLGPMLVSLGVSFTDWDLLSAPNYIGLENYERLFTRDRQFWQSLRVTLVYTVLYVPTELVGGLGLAVLMNRRIRGISIYRAIFYLPSILSGVAFVVVWMWMLHPQGLINNILRIFGITGPRWLIDPNTALISLWMMSLWGLGRVAVIYLAGLKNVPAELLDAAAVDGASKWTAFRKITLPLLSPTIFFNLVLSIISTFQTFTSAYVATNGGPLDSTLFYVLYLFQQAFQKFNMGRASAMAWLLFIIVLALTLLIVRSSRRWVYYEGERR
jgi:multiple sugar transport system permease protein